MQVIEEIYRARLQLLVDEVGNQRALAERIGKSPAQISQWINASIDSKTGKPRAMSRATAREIEARFPKPEGWMDQPVPLDALIKDTALGGFSVDADSPDEAAMDVEIVAMWLTQLTPDTRAEVAASLSELLKYPDSRLAVQRARNAIAHGGGAGGLPSWRDSAVEFITEVRLAGKPLNPETIVRDIDLVHSDRLSRLSAKSAQPTLTDS